MWMRTYTTSMGACPAHKLSALLEKVEYTMSLAYAVPWDALVQNLKLRADTTDHTAIWHESIPQVYCMRDILWEHPLQELASCAQSPIAQPSCSH